MCKRTREDIYEQLVQRNDALARIAVALEQIAAGIEETAKILISLADDGD